MIRDTLFQTDHLQSDCKNQYVYILCLALAMIFSYISDLLAAVLELYRKIMLTLKYKTLMCSHAELLFGLVM